MPLHQKNQVTPSTKEIRLSLVKCNKHQPVSASFFSSTLSADYNLLGRGIPKPVSRFGPAVRR